MAVGIGAAGILGIAFETTPGTYVAPSKYVPIRNESLAFKQDTVWRRPIQGVADVVGGVLGNADVSGDIELEALHDCIPYFIMASRNSFVKTGSGPYVYTFTPSHSAVTVTGRTLSITIVRNGICFAYTNCSITSQEYSIDSGLLIVKYTVMASDEAVQSVPTPTWPTSTPMGAGMYSLEIPTATPVTDSDAFTFTVNDSGENQFRLRSTGRGPAFAKFGERDVELALERDFQSRTDYDAFKALTSQSITLTATNGANIIAFKVPVAIKDTYEVGLSGQGDLLRASIKYKGIYDTATSKGYELKVTTTESIT